MMVASIPLLQSLPSLMMTHPSPLCLRSVRLKIYRNCTYGVLGIGSSGRPQDCQTNVKHHRRGRMPILRHGSSCSHQRRTKHSLPKLHYSSMTQNFIYEDLDKDGVPSAPASNQKIRPMLPERTWLGMSPKCRQHVPPTANFMHF
jgi:hypothetical protein